MSKDQLGNDLYLDRTEAGSLARPTITYYWPGDKSFATYTLVHQGDRWKIDSIRCTVGAAFNVSKS